jgi:hypothetical protein
MTTPFQRITAALAASQPNEEYDRILAMSERDRRALMTPRLRMSLGHYQQHKAAFEAQQGTE